VKSLRRLNKNEHLYSMAMYGLQRITASIIKIA